jgi:beta-glucosidase-like glycosyl hydrolase/CubicO group peptidase (beta-lactamase class C family)
MKLRIITLVLCAVNVAGIQAQFSQIAHNPEFHNTLSGYRKPPFLLAQDSVWVEKKLSQLTIRQQAAQLFMVAAYSNRDEKHFEYLQNLIVKHGIGGLIFFQGGPIRQALLTNRLQSKAQIPLLIGMDAEWGLSMRLDSTFSFPRQMELGAAANSDLVYKAGAAAARHCKRLGVHVSFSPVVDVNSNADNPIIGSRSFGELKERVAQSGIAYMKGLQDNGVLACAKHFPGHGDTDADSHTSLPVVNKSREQLEEIELYPFRQMVDAGVGAVMVAHLHIPSLDSARNMATTLSQAAVNGLLRSDLGFEGLAFTDALNMKGVSAYYKPGEVDLKALLAGNDILLFAEDVPTALAQIEKAIEEGSITPQEITSRCRKVLKAKYWAGLAEFKPISINHLIADLNTPEDLLLKTEVLKSAVTLLKNQDEILPFMYLDSLSIGSVAIGGEAGNTFQKTLAKYAPVKRYVISKNPSFDEIVKLNDALANHDYVIVSVHNTSQYAGKSFGVSEALNTFLTKILNQNKVVLAWLGNPYALNKFTDIQKAKVVIATYEDTKLHREVLAQAIFGAFDVRGSFPVSAGGFEAGTSMRLRGIGRFEYTIPESLGIRSELLAKIDCVAVKGIREKAYPGCQILVAKAGKVIYQKSFGHHTYDMRKPVDDLDIYDLASVTKIASSTFAAMRLKDEGKLDLDYWLCDYLPELVDTSPYGNVVLREMLSHKAGLPAWIPFYQNTLVSGVPAYQYYSLVQNEVYPYKVAENLYLHKDYKQEIYKTILSAPLRESKEYKYSDLGYFFLQKIVEKQTDMSLDAFVQRTFYDPMGCATTGYLPLRRFEREIITPTEYDKKFRRQLIHGHVHDPGAAMLGGVGGHAGLFSNANDLAKIMQCFMDFGTYGGRRYLSEATVKEFIRCQYCEQGVRRGAGFDKPARDGQGGPTCNCVSYESFGHTGFTGTMAWADPDEKIVYIFLSNRVYPDADVNKLQQMGIRTDIMRIIYDAISKSKADNRSRLTAQPHMTWAE